MSTGTTVTTDVPSATLGEPIACTLCPPRGDRHGDGSSTWLPALAERPELLAPPLNPAAARPAAAPIEASAPGAPAHPKDIQ